MTSTTEIKKYQEENLLLKKQIEERTGKSVEQLYAERAQRIRDAIELKEPDRVPFSFFVEPRIYCGTPNSAAYYDPNTFKLWSLNQVESFVKDLIDKCGRKGGLIIAIRMPDKAQTEEVQAMMKSLHDYGRY